VVYSIIQVDTVAKTIVLDRPLEATWPTTPRSSCCRRAATTSRSTRTRSPWSLGRWPCRCPAPGARAGIANYNGMSMRVVFTYDGNKQGTLVTLDTLLGVKVLDTNLGAVLLG
jgi:hypothetical protein